MGISLPSKSKSEKSSPSPIKLEFHLLEIKDCQSAEICQACPLQQIIINFNPKTAINLGTQFGNPTPQAPG